MSDEMTYKAAGVDIEAGYEAVRRIRTLAQSTYGPGVLDDIGSFGGFFALDVAKYKEPVLVSGTDGVGTKLKIAFMADRHNTVGIDLVAYCVNDIICQGAKPLFFLDYLATGKVTPNQIEEIVSGIAEGCRQAGCALIGGETAEMPGFYAEGEYDLAGFAVGVVDRKDVIDGSAVVAGDRIVAIGSTGLQSSGFSLVRRIVFDTMGLGVDHYVDELEGTIGDVLLTPTAVYAEVIMRLIEETSVHGIANISGGGLPENIPRAVRNSLRPVVRKGSWPVPPVFSFLQAGGGVSTDEMYRTFNMGVGMAVIVPDGEAARACEIIQTCGHPAFIIGEIAEATGDDRSLLFLN
ncbi:MAG: phosphoribosylformylglycinamidine cyclo-ligase [Limnochordia bacterium]|jgi:phosphoribosylformylglycinamidine cyclo-ligase